MLYAVVLAGLPGRIAPAVKAEIQEKYSDNVVVRATGALLQKDKLALYDNQTITDVVKSAADAVFGKSKRPHGFCRNIDRPCALRDPIKLSCGKTDEQTCIRQRPDFLLVLYQEGQYEAHLLEALHHCALTVKLPKTCYNHLGRTTTAVTDGIEAARSTLGIIKKMMESTKTPLLLPSKNLKEKGFDKLLSAANRSGAKNDVEQFKRQWFDKRKHYYICRPQLAFEPSSLSGRHGIPDVNENPALALSRNYRLGCQYIRDFHYDVYRQDEKHLSGGHEFVCREIGSRWPSERHINITVDDCILGEA
ncbi:hypothetical protein [Ensifer canadensis]